MAARRGVMPSGEPSRGALLEGHLSAFIQRTSLGMVLYEVVLDSDQRPTDYRILDVNSAYEGQMGVARADCVGRLASTVYGQAPTALVEALTRAVTPPGASQLEAYGSIGTRHYHISIVPLGNLACVATFADVTSFSEREQELIQNAHTIRTMMENQPYLAWLKDTEGRFVAVSTAFANACGRAAPEQVVGKTDFDIWPCELAQGYVNDDQEVMASRLQKIVEEPILDGQKTRWSETFKSPIVNDRGEVIGTVGYSRDISERKRAEEDRLKLEQQVMHAQKLESLGVLAGGIAHDFNNLLTSILGNADLALGELSPVAPACEHIQDIVLASRRAADLCRQMLAYSGKGRFVVKAVSLNEIVRDMAHLLNVSVGKKATLKYALDPDLIAVKADETQIRQVVMNLVTNASEALNDQSGAITLSTGVMDCDASHFATGTGVGENLASGRYAYLEVTDTGHGMDSATLARVFDPFFSTKFTGRGLGLPAVLGIVRGHKGAIRVHSEPGIGTTFRVLFPAVVTDEARPHPERLPRSGSTDNALVLLVDDEESILNMGRRILEKAGYRVTTARDGAQALEVFRQRQSEIRVIVLDLTMPNMDGEACFRELRRVDQDVKVIMTSGYDEQDIIGRFVGEGLAGFMQKPYTSAELLPKIKHLMGQ